MTTKSKKPPEPAIVIDMADALWVLLSNLPDGVLVRITLRRKTGQWVCQVGKVTGTGASPAAAIRAAVRRGAQA